MIINGNTFAHSSFQIDTRPLYITITYDSATSKYVPDVEYTADQIIEMSKTRQVVAKVIVMEQAAVFAPITNVEKYNGESRVVFGILSYSYPLYDSPYWGVRVVVHGSVWEVTLEDQN